MLAEVMSDSEEGRRRRRHAARRCGRRDIPSRLETVVAELAILAIISCVSVGLNGVVDALVLCGNRREKRQSWAALGWCIPSAAGGCCTIGGRREGRRLRRQSPELRWRPPHTTRGRRKGAG